MLFIRNWDEEASVAFENWGRSYESPLRVYCVDFSLFTATTSGSTVAENALLFEISEERVILMAGTKKFVFGFEGE